MNFDDLFTLFANQNIIGLFFKTFAVIFSFLYLIYSLVIFKQTQVMTKTLENDSNSFILLISLIQIIIGLALVFISLLLI
ncbi:hypothetical protein HYW87_03485 [Candidatus Roizmanbacteria bacterium]|nr:hypothetical protein [Candidatus Roizmanbacteria bacterium]